VANDVSRSDAGFEVATNAATFVTAEGDENVPLQAKATLAERILDRIEQLLAASEPAGRGAR
jgi:phosphopantothenoylcysteine decarboxylase/phosphopantothenate--cysteine ligase